MTEKNSNENVTKDELKKVLNLTIDKKSVVLAYLLWFFLGTLGVHRLYIGKTKTGITMLILLVLGLLTLPVGVGLLFLLVLSVWWMVDAVLLFLAARKQNTKVDASIESIVS